METTTATSVAASHPNSFHPLVTASYGTIVALWALSPFTPIPYVVHLLVLVTAILYAACHESLMLLPQFHNVHDKDSSERERAKDAHHVPLAGKAALFALYMACSFLNKDMYMKAVDCLVVTLTIIPALRLLLPHASLSKTHGIQEIKHSLPKWLVGPSPMHVGAQFTGHNVIAFGISVVVCGLNYYWGRPWYLNNILGISYSLRCIERFRLRIFKIGAILLLSLFLYDMVWAFGTEVMVTMVKNLNIPIQILFPRDYVRVKNGKVNLTLLGLGDIIIPGFFLALLLRFDAHRAQATALFFAKPYFHSALTAYVAGMALILYVMTAYQTAQPALLYLVPACLGSSMGVALWRGEVKELLTYSDAKEEVEEKE
jgi:minor histocompatibility antigen H13